MKDTMNKIALELEGVNMEDVIGFNKYHRLQTDYDWVNLYVLQVRGIDWRVGSGFVERCFKRAKTLRKYKGLMKINWKGDYEVIQDTKLLNDLELIGSDAAIKFSDYIRERKLRTVSLVGSKVLVNHLFAASRYEIREGSNLTVEGEFKPKPGSYSGLEVTFSSTSGIVGSTFELSSKVRTDVQLVLKITMYSSNNRVKLDLSKIPNAQVNILFYNTSGGSHIAKDNYVKIIGMKNEGKLTVNTNKENSNTVIINGEKWTEKSWLR